MSGLEIFGKNQLIFSGFLMYLVERTKIIWSLISDYLRIEFQTNEERMKNEGIL
jgi:hypothetical protein